MKNLHSKYIKKEIKLDNEFFRFILGLAKLDTIFRAKHTIDRVKFEFSTQDIEDLKKLITIIDIGNFSEDKTYILNPSFNTASILIGGADADFKMDDVLIDIKTTKHLKLKREFLNEIMGYYVLYELGGITGVDSNYEINKIGIYFARHAYLHIINVDDIINEKRFPKFLECFKAKAIQMNFGFK